MKEGDFSAASFKVEKFGIFKFNFFFKNFSFILVGISEGKNICRCILQNSVIQLSKCLKTVKILKL